jgi:DNA end-binding protein Ku
MATPRVLWKGAISFGLVHIPVALYPAARQERIDFDWLDKRSMQPVGYKRINKETGKEIDKDNIVKGIKGDDDTYVLLSDEEIKAALPKTTQTIEIESFVPADQIPFFFFDTPYFLTPVGRGEKVYALLRDTMADEGVVGVAKLVIQTKQHLAALIPNGKLLMVNTLRWASEIRASDELPLPGSDAKVSPKEKQMAAELVADMRGDWAPAEHHDSFREEIMALVQTKIEAGETKVLNVTASSDEARPSADIVDLTDLLRRSLKGRSGQRSGNADAAPQGDEAASARRRIPAGKSKAGTEERERAMAASAERSARATAKAPAKKSAAKSGVPSSDKASAKSKSTSKGSSSAAGKSSAGRRAA